MKADRDDAPLYLRQRGFKQSVRTWGLPILLGTCIALGLLQFGSSLLLRNTVQSLAHAPSPHSQTASAAKINYSAPVNGQVNWNRVVEEQLRRDNPQALTQAPTDAGPPTTPKQTVFHDQNYIPRGADNIVSLRTGPKPYQPYQPYQPSEQQVRVTVVGETPSMKERVCWPLKEGSIEKRNCKFSIGLNNRDRN